MGAHNQEKAFSERNRARYNKSLCNFTSVYNVSIPIAKMLHQMTIADSVKLIKTFYFQQLVFIAPNDALCQFLEQRVINYFLSIERQPQYSLLSVVVVDVVCCGRTSVFSVLSSAKHFEEELSIRCKTKIMFLMDFVYKVFFGNMKFNLILELYFKAL